MTRYIRRDDDSDEAVIVVILTPDGVTVHNPNEFTDEELAMTFDTLAAIYEEEGDTPCP